jgi:hypothetical protein
VRDPAEEVIGAGEMLLADHFGKHAGAHALGQGRIRPAGAGGGRGGIVGEELGAHGGILA